MELDGSMRGTYRLVVGLGKREVVFDTQGLLDYKGAVSRVAAAVRCHARDGRVVGVALQRRVPDAPMADDADPYLRPPNTAINVGEWTTLERWGIDVVDRIMTQSGGELLVDPSQRAIHHRPHRPAPSQRTARTTSTATSITLTPAAPVVTTPAVPVPEPKPTIQLVEPAPRVSDTKRLSAPWRCIRAGTHRWQLVVTVAVVAIAWLGVAFVMAGGRLDRLLGSPESERAAIATELPFHAPKPVPDNHLLTQSADDDANTSIADTVATPLATASPARPM